MRVLLLIGTCALGTGCKTLSNDGDPSSLETAADAADESTEETGPPALECVPEPGCGEEDPRGWAEVDTAWVRVFLGSPAMACGNENPAACHECGNFRRTELFLQPSTPPDETVTLTDVQCAAQVTDCEGNGTTTGGPGNEVVARLVEVTQSCVTVEIVSSSSDGGGDFCFGPGTYAVPRCS